MISLNHQCHESNKVEQRELCGELDMIFFTLLLCEGCGRQSWRGALPNLCSASKVEYP